MECEDGTVTYHEDYRPEDYEPYRDVMRRRHGYCGPYRLGIAIGEAGVRLDCPYTYPATVRQFWEGVAVGRERDAPPC